MTQQGLLLALLAALFAADAALTVLDLRTGSAYEANRLMAWLMRLLGVRGALLTTKGVVFALVWWDVAELGRALYAFVPLYACVVAWNAHTYYLIRRSGHGG